MSKTRFFSFFLCNVYFSYISLCTAKRIILFYFGGPKTISFAMIQACFSHLFDNEKMTVYFVTIGSSSPQFRWNVRLYCDFAHKLLVSE